jgi:RNA polymerase sigma-70 factor (ECF subfamily)
MLRNQITGTVSDVASERAATASTPGGLDPDSRRWLEQLAATGHVRDEAVARLHAMLLRAARFEVSRRRAQLWHLRGDDYDDLAQQSADDALVAVLRKLDDFRGDSRFTTWAYKFALYESAVSIRRRAWQDRELPLDPDSWQQISSRQPSPPEHAAEAELLAAVQGAIGAALSVHQREVLVAITLNGVPIDVLAERLNTTRGALYKTLHDARKKLRRHLAAAGFEIADADRAQS